jgi:hypothetical protein
MTDNEELEDWRPPEKDGWNEYGDMEEHGEILTR